MPNKKPVTPLPRVRKKVVRFVRQDAPEPEWTGSDEADRWLCETVPTDMEATYARATREAEAELRRGHPYVTIHCARLKLPSGIVGERWYVLTPDDHRMMPGSVDRNFFERIPPF